MSLPEAKILTNLNTLQCDGKTPCSKCARLGNICSYNSYATSSFGDLRKLRPSAHELQQLVQQNEILTRLFLEIQNASPDSTLQNIRAGSTFGEAAEALSEHVDETLNDQTAPSYLHDQPTVPSNTLEIIDGSTNITTSEARSGSHAGNSLQDRSTWHPSLQRRWQESEIVVSREFRFSSSCTQENANACVHYCLSRKPLLSIPHRWRLIHWNRRRTTPIHQSSSQVA